MNKIRILLADDHTIVRMGLVSLIACENDMTVGGEAENGAQAVELANELHPDVVIMDLMMPILSGAEATKFILDADPSVRIVILTSFGQSADLAAAVRNGASATILKGTDPQELTAAIRAVHDGQQIIPKSVRKLAFDDSEISSLTDRQMEILESVTRGLSNPAIARQFGISETCVKKHIQAICQKLKASNRAEAASIAIKRQMLKV